jgi:dTDP-4-amino-4,6-dideoxygalactose transaminase
MGVWPHFEKDEQDAVLAVLRSGKVNYWGGDEGRQFEKEFAEYHDAKYGVLVANGTLALELALVALGVEPGDEVVVPSKTFVATASSVFVRGAKPVCADVDIHSQNVTVETIDRVVTPKTKAIICVHFAGWPCEMDKIMDYAQARGLHVIEDCAQSHGAEYKGRKVGSWGHMAAFSFCQDKIMTTGGEGGMVLTNDKALWQKAWSYKDHGKSYDAVYNRAHPPGFRWLHEDFGTNWRMSEMQAAIGRVQLAKLSGWLNIRRELSAMLNEGLANIVGVRRPALVDSQVHSYYKYYLILDEDKLEAGWDRDKVVAELVARGVPALQGGCSEIYREKCFEKHGLQPVAPLKNASYLSRNCIMLPMHHNLTAADMNAWLVGLRAVCANAFMVNAKAALCEPS